MGNSSTKEYPNDTISSSRNKSQKTFKAYISATNFDAGNVSCTEPKLNKKKKLHACLLYDYGSNGYRPLYIEAPMTMKSSIESEQPVVVSFFEQLKALDEFMVFDFPRRFLEKCTVKLNVSLLIKNPVSNIFKIFY